jgi:alpha-L-rhamnosidase/F5/8 type C domain
MILGLKKLSLLLLLAPLTAVTGVTQNSTDKLLVQFENPPQSAHPRVWWHWMNGNITKEGITLDLDWMHRVGIAGYQNFDAALQTPQVVKNRLSYMTPEWKDAFKYAVSFGADLEMEEAIAGSPGWSESGGPWVPPTGGMKKYVWSETAIKGGKPFKTVLPAPPQETGAFQNIGIRDIDLGTPKIHPTPKFYSDSVVVAFRQPSADAPIESLAPKVTWSGGELNAALLTDGDLTKTTGVAIPEVGKKAWIQYAFANPVTIRSVTFVLQHLDGRLASVYGITEPKRALESSDDGNSWREITELSNDSAPETTISFQPVRARYFRVTFLRAQAPPIPSWAKDLDADALRKKFGPAPSQYEVTELVLHSGARVNHFEEKAAFVPVENLYGLETPSAGKDNAIAKASVIDLTSKMQLDGSLDWTPPVGKWIVLRFGYSLLGITNHPATVEATGLEVDKMNRRYVKQYMETYLDSYKETVGTDLMGKHGLSYVINDSWEAGSQNWTDDMIAQFKKLRGYDPIPWMPVLTGRVVESSEASDRFLWDFRKTVADLIASEHYGQLEETLHKYGLGHYSESHEAGRAFVADGMEVKKHSEIPMSAMWTQLPGVNRDTYGYNADDRESASVAHIYGQNIAAAESMTSCDSAAAWAWSPATLKPTADAEFLNGINRFVIHDSAHQPLIGKAPGMTLGPCGQWFNRNETWAEQAKPWVDYLSRTSFLLQQGHFGADLLYFYGEDSNLTAIFGNKAPNIPAGYGFDYINADALIHNVSVLNGKIATPSGMSYRLLALDPYSRHISLPVLRAIYKLVKDGAIVVAAKPTDDPSLADDQSEFAKLNNELFGNGSGVRRVGKGTVYAGAELNSVFASLHLASDFDYTKPKPNTHLEFVHRKLVDGDLYFVDNRSDRTEQVNAIFRVTGYEAELWHSDTGMTEPASFTVADGRTTVPLKLEPWGTVFVAFRKATNETSRIVSAPIETSLATIDGPWAIDFQPDRGAPDSVSLEKLAAWNENADPGVKYFSGTGTYTKTIDAPEDWFSKTGHIWIDLGDVRNLAEVSINGKQLGQVWHAPFRLDATATLHPGKNEISIRVTNAWVNRLIGDEQPNAVKVTFADDKPYNANSPLQASGLLGPVEFVFEAK